ncbi:MAG TPA: FHA domain-containing protein [Spirochaetota bacterium]|nr:FHA domain-containing protein [Spirochaetota bacterium]
MADETIYKRDKKAKEAVSAETGKGTKIRFQDKDIDVKKVIKIGRDPVNDIVIQNDPLVSRKHAIIEKDGETLYLEDKGSTNGTSVNNNAVSAGKKVKIKSGDTVMIGKTELKVVT